jgi:peptidoglycan-associated lipoprotein
MKRIELGVLALCASLFFVGCSSTPVESSAGSGAAGAPPAATSATPGTSGAAGPVASSTVATVTLAPHLDPASAISRERSVYFDYDDFSIKPEYASLLERHAKYLMANPTLKVRVEGNADERGGAEYNLALGQKRAEAVLKALKIYGANGAQMEAISWGKERPLADGHDEAAWARNRRVDLVYPHP